jgi:glucose/arabinose dehydrogenase
LKKASLLLLIVFVFVLSVVGAHEGEGDILINVGGSSYIDSLGRNWSADAYYNVGNAFMTNVQVNGTNDSYIYQSERWDPSALPEMNYSIPVHDGAYEVILHFAEIWSGAYANNIRVMDVRLENTLVLDNLDIYAEAGALRALKKSFNTTVTDGMMDISFYHVMQNPKISAIEIHPLTVSEGSFNTSIDHIHLATRQVNTTSSPVSFTIYNTGLINLEIYSLSISGANPGDYEILTAAPIIVLPGQNVNVTVRWTPKDTGDRTADIVITTNAGNNTVEIHGDAVTGKVIRINTGGPSYNDSVGGTWIADAYYNTGNTFISSSQISGTIEDTLYRSERFDPTSLPELSYNIPIDDGEYDVILHFAEIWSGAFFSGIRVFDVSIDNMLVLDNLDIYSQAGSLNALTKNFSVNITDSSMNISFVHVTQNPKISAIEIISRSEEEQEPAHLAHAVPGPAQYIMDIDKNGYESVHLDGIFSHTHAVGHSIVSWIWKENNTQIASGQVVDINMSVGTHQITLYVEDDMGNHAEDSTMITVASPSNVPGLVGYYYTIPNSTTTMPNFSSMKPEWGQIEDYFELSYYALTFRNTPFYDYFGALYQGFMNITMNGTYEITLGSDDGGKLYIDNALIIDNDGAHGYRERSANISLSRGIHNIKIEYFEGNNGAGLKLIWKKPDSTVQIIPKSVFSHDHSTLLPVINYIAPEEGFPEGGETVSVYGVGFIHPQPYTQLMIGNQSVANFTIVNDGLIKYIAPPGDGPKNISITTLNGQSNKKTYLYSENATPQPRFDASILMSGISNPTSFAFGPDGKLYVGTVYGEVWILTLDENNTVMSSIKTSTIQNSYPEWRAILGIGFNPYHNQSDIKLYVSHSNLFNGGENIYGGKISILSGPNLQNNYELITGLPTSDHDHGVDQFEFGSDGQLYIQSGGMTNAGAPTGSLIIDESPLSGAVLKADVNKQGFDGHVTYSPQTPTTAVQMSGFDIKIFATGFRNAYDIVMHSNGYFYGTDNGPNVGFGGRSLSCNQTGSDPSVPDELNLIEEGKYYGHPNRNRGALDPRQCVFHSGYDNSTANHTAPMKIYPASTNGIIEYRSNTFNGQLREHLILSRLQGELFDVKLSGDGRSLLYSDILSPNGGLDVIETKDGSLITADHYNHRLWILRPVENVRSNRIVSVTPYRAPMNSIRNISISGRFNASTNVSVIIGNKNCPVISFNSKEIVCMLPSHNVPGWVNVTVNDGGNILTFSKAFEYMNVSMPGHNMTNMTNFTDGVWKNKSVLPISLGEVSSAAVNGYLYLFGGSSNRLYRYNPLNDSWQRMADQNIAPNTDHMAAQTINGKIYAFGGLPASNALVIYNPLNDSWSLGAPLMRNGTPLNLGSVSSGVINNRLYIAGGISGNTSVNYTFVYYPENNTWQELASMPFGRNHAAGIGYNGKFYVFSGRTGPNVPSVGSPLSQVYDPLTNTWNYSIAAIPTPRGGMGTAVELNGELIVIGGEGNGPFNGTFNNVEAYNPLTNIWRSLPNMTTARHGIYPVVLNGNVHVVAGGLQQAFSQSNRHEVYTLNESNVQNATPAFAIRINTGGPSYVDTSGNTWSADYGYNTGNTFTVNSQISNTNDDVLYRSERFDPSALPELQYNFNVTNGDYTVRLHFAEIFNGSFITGRRVFNVSIEGNTVLSNFDIYGQAGPNSALIRTFNITVADSSMTIDFRHISENPKVSAIEILKI